MRTRDESSSSCEGHTHRAREISFQVVYAADPGPAAVGHDGKELVKLVETRGLPSTLRCPCGRVVRDANPHYATRIEVGLASCGGAVAHFSFKMSSKNETT